MKILIDNGHGINTPGKCSPDKILMEFVYTRNIARKIVKELINKGYDAELLVPEIIDISLKERAARANNKCIEVGTHNTILISVHINAFKDNGMWQNPRGWSCYTTKGESQSDILATLLYDEAVKNFEGHKIRMEMSDGDADWEEDFYILRHVKCPAVLTENFFMDNKDDVAFLLSTKGVDLIVATHVNAIVKYINHLNNENRRYC